jgi:hypothetical protein
MPLAVTNIDPVPAVEAWVFIDEPERAAGALGAVALGGVALGGVAVELLVVAAGVLVFWPLCVVELL